MSCSVSLLQSCTWYSIQTFASSKTSTTRHTRQWPTLPDPLPTALPSAKRVRAVTSSWFSSPTNNPGKAGFPACPGYPDTCAWTGIVLCRDKAYRTLREASRSQNCKVCFRVPRTRWKIRFSGIVVAEENQLEVTARTRFAEGSAVRTGAGSVGHCRSCRVVVVLEEANY